MAQLIQTANPSVTSSSAKETRACEHAGCRKPGWFGFSDGAENHWYCGAHKDEGEDQCRFDRLKSDHNSGNG